MDPATSEYAVKVAKALIKAGKKYVKAALEKDASNRYSLKRTWYLPMMDACGVPAGEYYGEVINAVSDGEWIQIWLNPYESTKDNPVCDGASKFPDVCLGVDLRAGAAFHDPWYREMDKIAKAFGVPVSTVRRLGDRGFKSVNLAENAGKPCVGTVSSLTYWGVRLFGGIYHRRRIAGAVVLAFCILHSAFCILLSGCVGTDFEDPGSYVSPAVEKVSGDPPPCTVEEVR